MRGKFNCGIYAIHNIKSNKYYIGSSSNLRKRKNQHFRDLRSNKHPNRHLQSAVNRNGLDNFIFITLEITEKAQLIEIEQKWINIYGFNNLYNLCPNAKSPLGRILSREAIENQQKSFMENGGHPNKKRVAQIDPTTLSVVRIWESAYQISKTLGFDYSSISKACRNRREYSYGYYWEFVENDENINNYTIKKQYKLITRNNVNTAAGNALIAINIENGEYLYFENALIASKELKLDNSYITKLLRTSKKAAKYEFYYAFT